MIVSNEAKKYFEEFLSDYDEGFIRVGRICVGGGWSSKIILGVSIEEDFNDDDDIRIEIGGLPFALDKSLSNIADKIRIEVDPDKGIVVITE